MSNHQMYDFPYTPAAERDMTLAIIVAWPAALERKRC